MSRGSPASPPDDRTGPGADPVTGLVLRPTWSTPAEALRLFLTGRTARIAAPVAAVVGTILSLLNQGYRLTDGSADRGTWIRVGLNYVVPFCVSSYGYLSARRVPAAPGP